MTDILREFLLSHMTQITKPKISIRRNQWDNWYGYISGKRVIEFAQTSTESQEQMALRWLSEGAPADFKLNPWK